MVVRDLHPGIGSSYEDLVFGIFGRRAQLFVEINIIIFAMGTMVAYTIVVGDTLTPIASWYRPMLSFLSDASMAGGLESIAGWPRSLSLKQLPLPQSCYRLLPRKMSVLFVLHRCLEFFSCFIL